MTLSPESSASVGLGKGCAGCYCRFEKFSRRFHFRELRISEVLSFVKIKSSRYGEITRSFTDIGKSWPSHEF